MLRIVDALQVVVVAVVVIVRARGVVIGELLLLPLLRIVQEAYLIREQFLLHIFVLRGVQWLHSLRRSIKRCAIVLLRFHFSSWLIL